MQLNPNIQPFKLTKNAAANSEVAAAIERVSTDVDRFFQFNSARPIYLNVKWCGKYYKITARYVVENSGGQHMSIASAFTN